MGKGWRWIWVGAAVIVLVGISLYGTRTGALRQRDEPIRIRKRTQEEEELQRIRAAASAGKLLGATMTSTGWNITVKQKIGEVTPYELFERTRTFFRNVKDTGVDLNEGVFIVTTDSFQDEWGHQLMDVLVMRVTFGRDSFGKTSWNTVPPRNIQHIADSIWLHEEITSALEEEEEGSEKPMEG